MKTKVSILLVLIVFIVSCKNDIPSGSDYGPGVYVINEGLFTQNNGSVSFFNPGSGKLANNIFEISNNRPSGDIVQSMGVSGDTVGYLIVNGLSKVEVVRLSDFLTIADPLVIDYPRYFLSTGGSKGYISSGSMSGSVLVVDLQYHEVTDTIPVGFGPEAMEIVGNNAFICNSGGFFRDSTVSVVDINTDQVTDTIFTGMCPSAILKDNDGNLWVYCRGYAQYDDTYTHIISESDAVIQKIDPVSGAVLWNGIVGSAGDYVAVFPKMAVNSGTDEIYYLRPDGMYVLDCSNPVINSEAAVAGNFYGIFVHPENSDLYLFEASLSGNGRMKIFNGNFEEVADYEVGIMPNGAVFVR